MFAVTQIDPSAPVALPRTEADEIASTLPEPRGTLSSMQSFPSLLAENSSVASASIHNRSTEGADFEDEDYEFQAALQASLMGPGLSDSYNYQSPPLAPPPLPRASARLPLPDPHTPSSSNSGADTPTSESPADQLTDLDPVAASMERNRLVLQRMKQEQEYAQRELWAENAAGHDAAALEARRLERQREEEEEAELLRRAIEESEATARAEGHAQNIDEDEDDNDDMDFEPLVRPTARQNVYPSMGQVSSHSVYDDDDAELQAALRASLEHVPEGWEPPVLPPHQAPGPPPASNENTGSKLQHDKDDAGSVVSDETNATSTDNIASDVPVEAVSVDELRRRRLARFGA